MDLMKLKTHLKNELKSELMSEQNHRFYEIEKQLNEFKGLTEIQKLLIKSQKQQLDCLKSKSEEQSKLIESQKADINLLKTSVIQIQQKVLEKPESDGLDEQANFHGLQKYGLKQNLDSETTQRLDFEKRLKFIENFFGFNNEMNSESNQRENKFQLIERKVNELKNKMESKLKSSEDNTLEMKLELIEKSIIEYQKEFNKCKADNEKLKEKMNCDQDTFHTIVSGLKHKMDSELTQRIEFENLLEEKVFGLSQIYSGITKYISNGVPIGFTYIQFFSQPSPLTLWPNVEWEDITSTYAGLFFRAEGNGSLPFGEIQEQQTQSLDISSGESDSYRRCKKWHRVTQADNELILLTGGKDTIYKDKFYYGIKVKFNFEEIRPRNQSIRIWTRIK